MNKHERKNPLILAFWWLHMNEVHIQSYIKVKKKVVRQKNKCQHSAKYCPQESEYLQFWF